MSSQDTNISFSFPLVKCTASDVLGALLVHQSSPEERYSDSVLKLETWILNFAEDQVSPLREDGAAFSEVEIEALKKKFCVISPLTVTLYLQSLQGEVMAGMSNAERERWLLQRMPDCFRARFKGNASCRNARDPDEEEDMCERQEEEWEDPRKQDAFAWLRSAIQAAFGNKK